MNDNQNLSAALEYSSKYGWAVFPVMPSTKRPLTPHGCKDAKKDARAIRAWWKRWPDASVGIATGSMSNLIVIDEDVDENTGKNGFESVRDWERSHGALPDTIMAITGRGGNHLYYHYTGNDIRNRAGILDGVDIRGEGGYVVAPPSIHPNGTEYVWEQPPEEFPLAEADAQVMLFLKAEDPSEPHNQFQVPTVIENGKRNDTLYRMACSLQARGLPDAAIVAAIKETNATACQEPLDDDELDKIVSSALQYAKGELKIITDGIGEWHEPKIAYKLDKNGDVTDRPVQSIANAEEAICYDKNLFGRIRYNELSYSPFVYGKVPWRDHKGWREWTDVDDSNLRSYIEHTYGLKGADRINDAFQNVMARYPINPVKSVLEECHRNWDGNQHVKTLLPSMLGCEQSEYNTEVMRIFMLGAVHRVFRPGCKFDYMLVLVGDQGRGKSSFLRFLALNDDWFNDNFSALDSVRAQENLRGMWIVELAELQAMKRAKDVETIKAFITSRSDRFRESYARRSLDHKRRCVLAGTSNPVDFLTDKTGNRRFLPITCNIHEPTFDMFADEIATKYEMAQAWGEIMDEYERCGGRPRLVLKKSLSDIAIRAQEKYTEEDPSIGIIQAWLDRTDKNRVCAKMIWAEALGHTYDDPRPMDINTIHNIMRNNIHGWKYIDKQKIDEYYGIQRTYERLGTVIEEENPFIKG